jgi:hypothetical protein
VKRVLSLAFLTITVGILTIGSVAVYVPPVDTNPPAINCGAPVIGNPSTLLVAMQDTESGLYGISILASDNIGTVITSGFESQPIPLETTSEYLQISRADENLQSSVTVQVTDMAGNVNTQTCTIPVPSSVPEFDTSIVIVLSTTAALLMLSIKRPRISSSFK